MAETGRLDGTLVVHDDPRSTHDAPGTRAVALASEQLAEGTERPWSVYEYMKLREAAKSVLAEMDVAQPMENFRESVTRSGKLSPTIALS